MSLALAFPNIDPVIVSFGSIAIRWYAVSYILGLLLGWRYIRFLAKGAIPGIDQKIADDFLVWCTLGVILGGRLGYVCFYQPSYFIENPLHILRLWNGGMSFHGGALGVAIAIIIFSRFRKINILSVADAAACAVPIGLFFGRIANFINGELYGRVSNVSWAMVFPSGGDAARHPSQLYEAFMEGFVLFILLLFASIYLHLGIRRGVLTGIFLVGYGIARIIAEIFRQPDIFLEEILDVISMGQILSFPMIMIGLFLILRVFWPNLLSKIRGE